MGGSRLAWIAAALAAACGEAAEPLPGALDRVYLPTGLAVLRPPGGEARLVVASSNADLRFDDASGGAVLAIDPEGAATTLGINIRSFAGEIALADPDQCGTAIPGPLAITATRGSDTLNAVLVGPDRLSCHRCDVPIGGPTYGDPFAVAVACGGAGRPRAFVGHLRSFLGDAWISEYDLERGEVRSVSIGQGPARAFAYDAARDRLYVLGLATGAPTPLRWIELGDCRVDLPRGAGGCTVGEATLPALGAGLELRSMAFAHPVDGAPQRAFLTARLYDPVSAALVGGRANDYGGLLLVVDLVDSALGGVDVEVVWTEEIGRGAQEVRVFPRLPSWPVDRGDVVAALAVDDGSLWIYDDETHGLTRFGRHDDRDGGRPELGYEPFGLAVDPEAAATARVYVGSFRESFITPVDVPLAAPDAASVVSTAGAPVRITGRVP